MDLNDFTSAENKKVSSENDIPTFTPPAGDAPKVGVDGKSKKAPTFTPPTTSSMDPGCYYHPEERVVGHCADPKYFKTGMTRSTSAASSLSWACKWILLCEMWMNGEISDDVALEGNY